MKLNAKVLVACALFAVACGKTTKKENSTKNSVTEEHIVKGQNLEEDEANVTRVATKVLADGTVEKNTEALRSAIESLFSDKIGDRSHGSGDAEAYRLTEKFTNDHTQLAAFFNLFVFARDSADGPQMLPEEAIAYAEKRVTEAKEAGDTAAKGEANVDRRNALVAKVYGEKVRELIKADRALFTTLLTAALGEAKTSYISDNLIDASDADTLSDDHQAAVRELAVTKAREVFVKKIGLTAN